MVARKARREKPTEVRRPGRGGTGERVGRRINHAAMGRTERRKTLESGRGCGNGGGAGAIVVVGVW